MTDATSSRRVLVTGANRGIGLGVVRQLLEDGHPVIATARRPDEAPELHLLAGQHGSDLRIEALDVCDASSVEALASRLTEVGSLDVLVNNAGINRSDGETFETIDFDAVRATLDANTLGPMRLTRALLPLLEKAERPVVVNVTSGLGSLTMCDGHMMGYRVSKAALNMFTRAFAADHPSVVCVSMDPGWVRTDMGGADAPLSVEESALGIGRVIATLQPADSGRFVNHAGTDQPW